MLSRDGKTKVPQIFFSYKSQYVLVQLLGQEKKRKGLCINITEAK